MEHILREIRSGMSSLEIHQGGMKAVWRCRTSGSSDSGCIKVNAMLAGAIAMAVLPDEFGLWEFCAQAQDGSSFYILKFDDFSNEDADGSRRAGYLMGGDIQIWSSLCSLDGVRLGGMILLVPAPFFECMWPSLAQRHEPIVLEGIDVLSILARSGVEALWRSRKVLGPVELQSGLSVVVDLLSQSWNQPRSSHRSKAKLYEQIRRYIDMELKNPSLDPRTIARHHGCSVRGLHSLFSEYGQTVSGMIRQRRLDRCRAELQAGYSDRIGDIASRWGFGDAAHFSKLFKLTYGVSPRIYRSEFSEAA